MVDNHGVRGAALLEHKIEAGYDNFVNYEIRERCTITNIMINIINLYRF